MILYDMKFGSVWGDRVTRLKNYNARNERSLMHK